MTTSTSANPNAPVVPPSPVAFFRPKFALYHASPKGTGCALKMALHPAHDTTDGSIWMTLANQMTIGNRMGPNPTYPRFDWENSACVKLDFNDLCKILQVFRGEIESIEDGKGLYHTSPRATTRIVLRHLVDPVAGYSLEIYRTPRSGGEDQHYHFFFNSAEACGLTEAIADVMGFVAFGIPVVLPHDTSEYVAQERASRNAAAA